MTQFEQLLDVISGFVWGVPLIALLVGTGIWLTVRLGFLQFSKLYHALWLALIKRKEDGSHPGDITHFQALMTAMSATVGTGNIAGVATAIAIGGPGAIFWLWLTGLVGMATKYAEAVLAVKYRVQRADGSMGGGPMYYIEKGMKMKWLGVVFAVFAVIASFGIGNMVQSNSVADAMQSTFGVPTEYTGLILMVITALVVIGGIKSIAKVTSVLVPFMIILYVVCSVAILVIFADKIPSSFALIFQHAFQPSAATGGFAGASVMLAMRMGIARGIFSNESGMGSAPIAAAAAQTKHPVTQALVSMTQTFIDTLIVCTMTGLVIIVTGAWDSGLNGAQLTTFAFASGYSAGPAIVAISLALFAYSTILGWCYYGERSLEYLFGLKSIKYYRYIFILFVGIGAISKLNVVWLLSDIFNGLMALPNLIALLVLTPVVVKETKDYFDNIK